MRRCALALSLLAATPALSDTMSDRIKIDAGQSFYDSQCHRCHADNSTDPSYGPTLVGIVGRQAGSVAGYDYSDALANSGIHWTPAALRAWMEDNKGLLPGTKMRHVGITDRTVQDFILAYLGSISE